jgi:hypothetical protein
VQDQLSIARQANKRLSALHQRYVFIAVDFVFVVGSASDLFSADVELFELAAALQPDTSDCIKTNNILEVNARRGLFQEGHGG